MNTVISCFLHYTLKGPTSSSPVKPAYPIWNFGGTYMLFGTSHSVVNFFNGVCMVTCTTLGYSKLSGQLINRYNYQIPLKSIVFPSL